MELDLFVVGAGSGGVRAARVAAEHGASVGIAEEHRYGGTCVIRGCVPKKLFVYASEVSAAVEDAAGFGWRATAELDWGRLVEATAAEITRLSGIYRGILDRRDIASFDGRAHLVDDHTVEIVGRDGTHTVTARNLLIATGGRPYVPRVPGAELGFTSNEVFGLPSLPRRVAIVGGGFIACEFAAIFRGLGCEVTLIYRGEQILREFDDDLRAAVAGNLRGRGVDLALHAVVERVDRGPGGALAVTTSAGATIEVDGLMWATGRTPNTAELGLAHAGVVTDGAGAVVVDDYSRSSVPHIYAVGDCTNRINLTPVAIRDGHAVADTLFGPEPRPVDHAAVPKAVFTQPCAASVGATEAEARERGEVDVYVSDFRPLKDTLSGRGERVMLKMVVDAATERVLGVHMVGEHAAEIVQVAAIAVRAGLTKSAFDHTVALHPTSAEELVLMRKKRP